MSAGKQKIMSLQGIKVIAFLMVFFSHAREYLPVDIPDLGARAVELFIFISGFTMIYNHFSDKSNGFKSIYISKFKKYFPIHLITLIAMIPYMIIMITQNHNDINMVAKSFVSNLLLLQSWIPIRDIYFSFNTVSWYLSMMLFCWAFSPFLIRIIKKYKLNKKKNKLIVSCIIILALKFLIEFSVLRYLDGYYDFVVHLLPLYRVLDYLLGMMTGLYFLENKKNYNKNLITILQVLSVGLYIFVVVAFKDLSYRVIYFPFIIVMVYIMCFDGFVSKIVDNSISRLLSKISLEFFMVHMIVISYWQLLLPSTVMNDYLQLIIIFILSVLLSYLLKITLSFLAKKRIIKN